MNETLALVVDHDARARRAVGEALSQAGVCVLSAADGAEALALVQTRNLDVIFVELVLPDMDGISVLAAAQRLRPRLASVVMAANASVESSVEALRHGACDFVFKPAMPAQVHSALERAMQKRSRNAPAAPAQQAEFIHRGPAADGMAVIGSRMRKLLDQAIALAGTGHPVLLVGEPGVGKDTLARAIHRAGSRAAGPFVRVNCGSVNQELSTRVAAGGVCGADGVDRAWPEHWERARGGTLLVFDVDQMEVRGQWWLLGQVHEARGPACENARVAPRIIAATTRDLRVAANQRLLRHDLYERLGSATTAIPPLRDRREEIEPLAMHFLRVFGPARSDAAAAPRRFAPDAMARMLGYSWPGNVAELSNVVQRVAFHSREAEASAAALDEWLTESPHVRTPATVTVPLSGNYRSIERHLVHAAIVRCDGNKSAAARMLGMHRRTLYRLLDRDESASADGSDTAEEPA
jgi:DNA-binding NtrC family response regulator